MHAENTFDRAKGKAHRTPKTKVEESAATAALRRDRRRRDEAFAAEMGIPLTYRDLPKFHYCRIV